MDMNRRICPDLNVSFDSPLPVPFPGPGPIGLGTADAESPPSFIMRIPASYEMTVHSFLTTYIGPLMEIRYLAKNRSNGASGIYEHFYQISGVGERAVRVARALEALTGRGDLHLTTLARYSQVLPPQGLLRPIRALCKVCMNERRNEGLPYYERESWNIQAVTSLSHP